MIFSNANFYLCSCIDSTYGTPPGSVRVEVETGNEGNVATDLPPLITDITVRTIKLDQNLVSLPSSHSNRHPNCSNFTRI